MITLLFGFVSGLVVSYTWEFITVRLLKIGHLAYQHGYHFHHSLLSLPFSISVLFIQQLHHQFFVIGIAIGIVLQHSTTDGFVFISKEKCKVNC